jgi:hypothetical protein
VRVDPVRVDPVGAEPKAAEEPARVAVVLGERAPLDGGIPQMSQYPSWMVPVQSGWVHDDAPPFPVLAAAAAGPDAAEAGLGAGFGAVLGTGLGAGLGAAAVPHTRQ